MRRTCSTVSCTAGMSFPPLRFQGPRASRANESSLAQRFRAGYRSGWSGSWGRAAKSWARGTHVPHLEVDCPSAIRLSTGKNGIARFYSLAREQMHVCTKLTTFRYSDRKQRRSSRPTVADVRSTQGPLKNGNNYSRPDASVTRLGWLVLGRTQCPQAPRRLRQRRARVREEGSRHSDGLRQMRPSSRSGSRDIRRRGFPTYTPFTS